MGYQYRQSQDCIEWAIGRQWTFGRFTRLVWQDMAKFGRTLIPDPVAIALANVEKAVAIDANCVRQLMADDVKESEAAKQEGRKPNLLLPRYLPTADGMVKEAYRQAGRYLSAQSPQLTDLLHSVEGGAYLFYLLLNPKRHDDPPTITVTEDVAYDVYWDLDQNEGADGRKTIKQILEVCNGTAPEPAKNGEPPAV